MNTHSRSDLGEFYQFVGEKVNIGGVSLSPEEVLDEWRTLHPHEDVLEEAAAIQEAVDDLEKGDTGIPFDEFDRDFRARRNLPNGSCHS